MDLIEAIKNRRSIRSFKPDPVPREILEQLIEVSRWSPSGSNTQPWELAILGGEELQKVKERITRDSQSSQAHPDIPYPPMPEPFISRQRELGKQMNAYLVARQSGEDKKMPRAAGAQFFGAPNAIIVSVEREICPRAFLGLGMVAQTIALAALHFGLGTCIMSMVTYWPEVYRELLKIPDPKLIAYGIAIGYPDMEAPVNSFPRTRLELDSFVRWYGV